MTIIKDKNFKAQNAIEFAIAFVIIIIMLVIFVDFAMYWRAVYTVETVANQVMARAQLTDIPTGSTFAPCEDVKEEAKKALALSAISIANLEFSCIDAENDEYELALVYKHFGIFLFPKGIDITSSVNSSTPKY